MTDAVLRLCRGTDFGYTRLMDALHELEYRVSRSTIARILKEHGIEPAPERGRRPDWRKFFKAHLDYLAGADFFTVEVVTWRGLVRYFVFFVMEIKTRRVHIAGITSSPDERWMMQIGRNLTDHADGFLRGLKYLVLDRDPLYTTAFRRLLKDSKIKVCRIPPRSPNLNAHAERWVRSIRSELLNRIVPLGEGHLRWAIQHYVVHYNRERHHQGLQGMLIEPEPRVRSERGPIVRRMRVGGLLNFYYRRAC